MRSSRKNDNLTKAVISFLILAITAVGAYFYSEAEQSENVNSNIQPGDILAVNFLDVGQGDCEFIQLPDGKCMLIDAGVSDSASKIASKISELGYEKIDYLIATHPHADHIGGMKRIIENFEIGDIYMPKASTNTKTFENLLQAIADKGLSINTAKAGKVICESDDLKIEFLAPVSDSYKDLNNYSAVIRLQYGNNVFLFTGDAEALAEGEMLSAYSKSALKADVLKVGHHGSNTASSVAFINTVSPKYAVIEVGNDNSYNHPHTEAINHLNSVGAEILRTDLNGNIIIISDKTSLTVQREKD
ncbi:MAG: MBL fold metallo-hydrolase [Eubacterium sp.]|nr:MBL fold metallo-hydrolase [Eubacterium sp.]